MTTRLDLETAANLLLSRIVQQQLAVPKNRAKGVPTEDVPRLLRMAADKIDEALRAMRTGRGTNAALAEIGDAGAVLALAAWRVVK